MQRTDTFDQSTPSPQNTRARGAALRPTACEPTFQRALRSASKGSALILALAAGSELVAANQTVLHSVFALFSIFGFALALFGFGLLAGWVSSREFLKYGDLRLSTYVLALIVSLASLIVPVVLLEQLTPQATALMCLSYGGMFFPLHVFACVVGWIFASVHSS